MCVRENFFLVLRVTCVDIFSRVPCNILVVFRALLCGDVSCRPVRCVSVVVAATAFKTATHFGEKVIYLLKRWICLCL